MLQNVALSSAIFRNSLKVPLRLYSGSYDGFRDSRQY